ncbi:MAG: rRNA maturation RNase YbeY [Bacteroidota bacterium]
MVLKNKIRLKHFLASIVQDFRKNHRIDTINYIFCSDEYLLTINQEYLQHDTYTDIITFDLSNNETEIVSDIYISIDRVKENAQKFNSSMEQELHRVLFHGILHLCGLKDKSKQDAALMRAKEEYYLNTYFKQ